jgi:MFS family permease
MPSLRKLLAAFSRLLPVRPSESDLEGASKRERRQFPANFAVIAINGLFFPTAGRILGAGLLLTWFVSDLTPSATFVAIIVPIQYGLALIAQPLFAGWLAGKRRLFLYYTAQSLLRGALWCALGLASYLIGDQQAGLLLLIFFAVIMVDATAAGVGNIVFNDTLARVIPRRLRGRVRSWRGIFGGMAAGVAGLLIRSYFSEHSGVRAFGLLFAVAGLFYAAGGLVFALIQGPEGEAAQKQRIPFSDRWRKFGELWRDAAFRRFIYVEVMLVPLVQALPFFTLFARRRLGIETESLGLLVTVDAVAPVVGNFVWGKLADSLGNRRAIIGASLCGLIAPALGFILYVSRIGPGLLALSLFAGIVFSVGVAATGIDLATKNHILDLAADEAERPIYIGVNDTLVGLPTMLLAATGLVIDLFGFLPVFIGLGVLTIAASIATSRLPFQARSFTR